MQLTSLGLRTLALLVWLIPASIGCSGEAGDKKTTAAVCSATAPAECPDPAPSYADVAPIFEQRCASCHTDAPGAPWPLDSYENVIDWIPVVRDDVRRCSMPPLDSDVAMSADERQQLLTWIECGAQP
jgi:uncharacterized membrane protein